MNPLGFTINENRRYRIDGKIYRLNSDGAETLSLLMALYNLSANTSDGSWAVKSREKIRRIEYLNCRSALVHVIAETRNYRLRTIAIWLRGRCGGYIGTSQIANLGMSDSLATQKECVRALKRLSAWAQLRKIAESTQHQRIRELASQRRGKRFSIRLHNVLRDLDSHPASGARMAAWMQPGLILGGRPPKPATLIREILERIHCVLLHGGNQRKKTQ